MKNKNCTVTALALLAFAVCATQTRAQRVYTPYAFTNFAGFPGRLGNTNGTGTAARFNFPEGVAVDTNGNVFVADSENNTIRMITPGGMVTTIAGSLTRQTGTNDGIGSAARFYQPWGVALDRMGNVYIGDTFNHTIRKLTPDGTNWLVTTLAGLGGSHGYKDDIGTAARFYSPVGVAVDSAGNVYVSDRDNYKIRKIVPDGVVTTLAGGNFAGGADGTGSAARFWEASGLAVDSAGNLYVGDSANAKIRKVTPNGTNWDVTTLAGSTGHMGNADGTGSAARFYYPEGVAVDGAGNVYVADTGLSSIRRITPTGVVTTLAGGQDGGARDGIGMVARFYQPEGIAVDSQGYVYVGDSLNERITKGMAVLQFDTSAGYLTLSNDFFQMRLIGPYGSNLVVEASANLAAWIPIQTNTLPPLGLDVSVPLDANQYQFFRARLVP